jgi:ankyrin repeat protein
LLIYWTPLHYAAEAGKKEIVKVLIASRVDLNRLTHSNSTARYWASINHHRDIERLLVKYGALGCDAEYEMIMKKLA